MKKFEKQLKLIQSEIAQNEIVLTGDLDINDYDLNYLVAKKLIMMEPAGDNQFYVLLDDLGFTYFDDKKEQIKSAFLHWSISIVVAVISAVFGSVITLVIQHALSL